MYRDRPRRLTLLIGLLLIAAAGGLRGQESVLAPDASTFGSAGAGRVATSSISGMAALREAMRRDSLLLVAYLDSLQNTPQARMKRALTLAPSEWMPTAADRARREAEIWHALGFDQLFTSGPRVGVSVPLSSIGRALGLVEDVSPRIQYTLLNTEPVSVVIYDLAADTVVVLVDGPQRPGVYDFNWDFLDARGRRVGFGSYVAEVIAGRRILLRKRIEVP